MTIHHFGEVVSSLEAFLQPELLDRYRPRYNIAPGDEHWILRWQRGRREITPATWGFSSSGRPAPLINARAETLHLRPTFREAFAAHRCVIPADGFYEWQDAAGGRRPTWFHAPDTGLLLLAGLYEGGGDPRSTANFTIITTAASEPVKALHHRMPALLQAEEVAAWLHGSDPGRLLRPASPGRLTARAVSRRVNSPANDDPACLEPADQAAGEQLRLF